MTAFWYIGPLLLPLAACASASHEPVGGAVDAVPTADAALPGSADAAVQPGSADATATGCSHAVTATLATWSFASEPGNQASTAVTTTVTGLTASPLQRASALTAVSGANAINSSNWSTAAQLDPTRYYALTLAPPSGCTLSITSIAIDAKASATGPTLAGVATSLDSFAQLGTISTSAPSMLTIATVHTAPIELRVFGYGASSTAGTLRLQGTLSVQGSLH